MACLLVELLNAAQRSEVVVESSRTPSSCSGAPCTGGRSSGMSGGRVSAPVKGMGMCIGCCRGDTLGGQEFPLTEHLLCATCSG